MMKFKKSVSAVVAFVFFVVSFGQKISFANAPDSGKVYAEFVLMSKCIVAAVAAIQKNQFKCVLNYQSVYAPVAQAYAANKKSVAGLKNIHGDPGDVIYLATRNTCSNLQNLKKQGYKGPKLIYQAAETVLTEISQIKGIYVQGRSASIPAGAKTVNYGQAISLSVAIVIIYITLFCKDFEQDRDLNCI